jgi:hypothetical protein
MGYKRMIETKKRKLEKTKENARKLAKDSKNRELYDVVNETDLQISNYKELLKHIYSVQDYKSENVKVS